MHKNRLSILPLMLSAVIAVSAVSASPAAGTHLAKKAPAKQSTPAQNQPKPSEKADPKAGDKDKKETVSAATIDASIAGATQVDPMTVMQNPGSYMNKKVTFSGTFNRFADIALDYKKAFRDSRDYVTFFILRPDVTDHTIPMSEMKLFFPRKRSDEVMDLEPGDKIQIVGSEFATALEEPWIDVDHIKILQKVPRSDKKHSPEF